MMLRKVVLTVLASIVSLSAWPRSVDEKIANAMSASDWFALDSIYNVTPKDSINPFLEVFARCLLGNRLNRPDVSIPAFQELLNTQSESLGLGNLLSSASMLGMDLSRVGRNADAAAVMSSVVDATRQYLDSTTVANLSDAARRFGALAQYEPYRVEMPQTATAYIPFEVRPVGPAGKGSVMMHTVGSTVNGKEADIVFDTGAGANVMSPEMAERYGLIPLEGAAVTVAGVERQEGYVAIAREMRLGDIVVRDVPFVVVELSSRNEEADKYMGGFNIIVGSELMLRLKDLTIDFVKGHIAVPTVAPERSGARANMCFSSGMNLLTGGEVAGKSDDDVY